MRDAREKRVLAANGQPIAPENFKMMPPTYLPGHLAQPMVVGPYPDGQGKLVSWIYGGAGRMETIASQLLAGALTNDTLERCGRDVAYRQSLIDAAVATAWDLVGAASVYRGPEPEDMPSETDAAVESATDQPTDTAISEPLMEHGSNTDGPTNEHAITDHGE